jgi:cytochrome c-type biogenesis protein CcmH
VTKRGFARGWLPWIALGVVVVIALAVVLWPHGDTSPAARAHALETELKCPECEGLSVADSNAPTSRAIRTDIKRRIAHGQGDAEIRQAYVDRYGEEILLQPQSSGLSLLVWILPVVVLVVGALGIGFVLARNRREPKLHATEADEQLVERARERQ